MTDTPPVEEATAYALPAPGDVAPPVPQQVAVEPTQMRRPWQATIRTGFQALLALATLIPLVLTEVYESPDAYPAAIAQVVLFAGLFSRIMAMPGVEEFLRSFLPFLAAAPPPKTPDERGVTVTELCLIVIAVAVAVFFIVWLVNDPGAGR